jgi:beta-phosphoglucomutase
MELNIINYDNFIFDLDGTLVDSNWLHKISFDYALKTLCPSLEFTLNNSSGLNTKDYLISLGIDNDILLSNIIILKQRFYREISISKLNIFNSVDNLLINLKTLNKKIYIVTNSSKLSSAIAINKLKQYITFSGIIDGDDVLNHKPHPEPYLMCLKNFYLDLDKTIAIEDSISGVESAKNASLKVIGIKNFDIMFISDFFFKDFIIFNNYICSFLK